VCNRDIIFLYNPELTHHHSQQQEEELLRRDKHISILQERLRFAIQNRERLLQQNPDLTDIQLWHIDHDISIKKRDLENAVEYLRMWRRDSYHRRNH
jgi:hypothetical protein